MQLSAFDRMLSVIDQITDAAKVRIELLDHYRMYLCINCSKSKLGLDLFRLGLSEIDEIKSKNGQTV